jgi:hypothetical protein
MNGNFDELVNAIKELRKMVAPLVKANNLKIKQVIEQKITDTDFLDHLLDDSLELCYNTDDHSGYLSLIEYVRSFDADMANEHYQFYYGWFINTDITEDEQNK